MRLMAEFNIAGIGGKLVTNRPRSSGVALQAVGFYTESRFFIMAVAAGSALLHLVHGETFIAGTRNVQCGVAVLAAVGRYMHSMAEFGAAGAEMDLLDRMAFLTVGFYAKCGLPVMAGAARAPLFHFGHALSHALFSGFENLIMAFHTGIHALVNSMAEGCVAGFLDTENDIDGGFVTFVTITFYTENS